MLDNSSKPKQNWKDRVKWQKFDPISFKNCTECTGQIERGEYINKTGPRPADNNKAKKEPAKNVFLFGKYKGRSYEEIEIENPGYMEWCRREIKGFKG